MVADLTNWVGRTLVGNDGGRLGTIAEVYTDDDTGEPQWLAIRVPGQSELRLVPARGTTERGVKDIVTWLDKEDLDAAPEHMAGDQAEEQGPPRVEPVEPIDFDEEAEPEEPEEPDEPDEEPVAAPRAARRAREHAGTSLMEIEGLGPADRKALAAAGIRTTEGLLEAAGSPAGRRSLARKTGIDAPTILEWVNRADLIRIRGVGREFSDLLETAGVDSVRELATRKPANLQRRMEAINDEQQLVRRAPSLAEVERWVEEAKTLPLAVTH